MSTLGDRLRKLRKETGKSQKEFGKLFDLSESAIGMYERNERKPDYKTLERFAKYLNTNINYLITGKNTDKTDVNSSLPVLSIKNEKDIAKKLENILDSLDSDTALAFDGEPMDDETKEMVRAAIESNLILTKKLAKKKFTPKKYRKE